MKTTAGGAGQRPRPRPRRIAVLGVLLLLAGSGHALAQEAPPAATLDVIDLWNIVRHKPAAPDTPADYRKAMKAWAPVIGAKPSAGVMFGVAGNVAFFRGEPSTTHISSIVTSATVSTKKQTAVSARFMWFTPADAWRFEGDDRANWTSQDIYGLGTATPSDAALGARFNFFRVHQTSYRRIRPGLFGGLGFHFDKHSSIRPGDGVDDASWNGSPFVEYSQAHSLPLDTQTSAGLSANLLVDTRDSTLNPRRGWLTAIGYRGLINGFLGGSSGWQLLHAEGRAYVSLTADQRHRLAFWTFGDFVTAGTAPYLDLPATGTDTYGRSARGYGEGRFRGERLLYGEVEYRGALTANGLLGVVMFFNVTTISNLEQGERLFDSAAPAGGAGLRLLINKHSRTNLCLDFGAGKQGSHGVYLGVQEAF